MKKVFLLIATLCSMSSVSFAQEQGEDNGFGLKFHAGFYNEEKYGLVEVEEDGGLFGNLMDAAEDAAKEEAGYETKNIPLFGMSIDNRWYVANPGNFGIAIDARWLDFGIGKTTYSFEGEEYQKTTHVQAGLLMPGVIGTFYLGNEMAVDAFYNVGATLALNNSEAVGAAADSQKELEELGFGGLSNMMSGIAGVDETVWGFGVSHFIGASFRYKVFQAGIEYNIAKLKTVDWFDDDDNTTTQPSNDDMGLGDMMNSILGATEQADKDAKRRFNNFRVFLGFKF